MLYALFGVWLAVLLYCAVVYVIGGLIVAAIAVVFYAVAIIAACALACAIVYGGYRLVVDLLSANFRQARIRAQSSGLLTLIIFLASNYFLLNAFTEVRSILVKEAPWWEFWTADKYETFTTLHSTGYWTVICLGSFCCFLLMYGCVALLPVEQWWSRLRSLRILRRRTEPRASTDTAATTAESRPNDTLTGTPSSGGA